MLEPDPDAGARGERRPVGQADIAALLVSLLVEGRDLVSQEIVRHRQRPRSDDVDGLMSAAMSIDPLDLADELDEGGRRI